MEKRARSAIASGAILVALGVLLLVARLVPGFWGDLTWPFIVIGVGVLLLVLAVATGKGRRGLDIIKSMQEDIADERLDDFTLIQAAFILSGAATEDSLAGCLSWYEEVLSPPGERAIRTHPE